MNVRDYFYDYPFFFVFLSLVGLFLFFQHNFLWPVFLLLLVFSAFIDIKVTLLCICILISTLLFHYPHSKITEVPKSNVIGGTIYDLRQNRSLNLLVKSQNRSYYLFASKLYDNLNIGDSISFKSHLFPLSKLKNRGFRNYLISKNVRFYGFAYDIKKKQSKSLISFVNAYRLSIEKEFYYFLNRKNYIFTQNALFGDSRNRSQIKHIFINTQTAHILSVSGIHMGFVFTIFYTLFYFIISNIRYIYTRFHLKIAASITALVPTMLYFFMSGMHIPAIRAFALVIIFIFAMIFGIKKNTYNSLFFVASMFVMIFGVDIILSASFIMSFVMSFFAIYLASLVSLIKMPKAVVYIIFSVLMSISAMPLIVYYFHKISFISPLANVVVVPYFGFVLLPLSFTAMSGAILGIYQIEHIMFYLLNLFVSLLFYFLNIFNAVKPINFHISTLHIIIAYSFWLYIIFYVKKTIHLRIMQTEADDKMCKYTKPVC